MNWQFRVLWRVCVVVASAQFATPAFAGGGPESTFLVINARGAKSKEVANHYIKLRHIPPQNVFYVPAPPNANRMVGLDFRQKLLLPILQAIDKRGLREHIDQIVYSCEFPTLINFEDMFATANLPKQLRAMASLTGATYLHQFVEQSDVNLVQLNTNFFFTPPQSPTITRAFRGRYLWAPGGARVTSGGRQYLLATQLGCTQPEANTVDEILMYLDRAAAADGTRPEGTFFYMKNKDIRSQVREPGFADSVKELLAMGLKAEIGNGVVPTGGGEIVGLTTGSAHVPLATSGSKLMPGAIVDNLTSSGGILVRVANPNPQTRISEYLRLGAAGATGTVIEPFAIKEKFPSPAVHVHYARGATLAEAVYQSVQGPYQLLLLGDPLCQPWARIPEVTVEGIAAGDIVSGTIELKPVAKLAEGQSLTRYDLYVDGRRRGERGPGQKFPLDTTQLADGYHELRIVARDASSVETQGRWIAGVLVKNGRDAVSLVASGGPHIATAQIELTVTATVDATTAVFHNGRELGRVTGRRGTLTIAADRLGAGPVVLEAQTVGEPPRLRAQPLELEIARPR